MAGFREGRRAQARVLVALAGAAALTGALIYVATKNSNPAATISAPATTDTVTSLFTTGTAPPPPVTEAGLDRLLLTPDEIDSAMGAKGMAVADSGPEMFDESDFVPDKACLPLASVAEDRVYAGSGWTAVRKQELESPQNDRYVGQAVVLFPTAHDAEAFFTASTQKWPACSNRHYLFTQNQPPAVYSVKSVANVDGTLSVRATIEATGRTCERALTAYGNVVADVAACSSDMTDQGVAIAHQIAAKVRTP